MLDFVTSHIMEAELFEILRTQKLHLRSLVYLCSLVDVLCSDTLVQGVGEILKHHLMAAVQKQINPTKHKE